MKIFPNLLYDLLKNTQQVAAVELGCSWAEDSNSIDRCCCSRDGNGVNSFQLVCCGVTSLQRLRWRISVIKTVRRDWLKSLESSTECHITDYACHCQATPLTCCKMPWFSSSAFG